MPIIGKSTGFNYTDRWGIDVGHPAPIQLGSRPPSHQDWELFSDEEKALFGLPDWATYQKYQQAYEKRSQEGGDIYQEKQRAAQILLQGKPRTWAEARQMLIDNGFDPSVQASGPLFKELEIMWNGGSFRAGHDIVNSGGTGMSGIATWLPGLGRGMAMEEWFRKGTSSMEGFDAKTNTWWNRRPDGTMEYFDTLGNPLSGPPPGFTPSGGRVSGGPGGGMGMGGGFLGGYGAGNTLDNELAQQTHLDTLGQAFQLEKAAREYGEALPLESFLTDFYGDILGVDFQRPQFSLDEYMQQGMQGAGQGGGGYGFALPIEPGKSRTGPKAGPNGTAPGGAVQPVSPGAPPFPPGMEPNWDVPINDTMPGGGQSDIGASSMSGRSYKKPLDPVGGGSSIVPPDPRNPPGPAGGGRTIDPPFRGGVDFPNKAPIDYGGLFDGGGVMIGGGGGTAAPFPRVPLPTMEGKGYSFKTGPSMDLADQRTWGMLAPEVNREVEDMDNLLKNYRAQAPMGGERGMAEAEMFRDLGGSIQGIRQNLMQSAISGISGLAGAKKGFNPAGYSGSGAAMLSDATTRRGQDIQNSQFGQNLDFQRKSIGAQLKAQRQASRNSLWGQLLGAAGQAAAAYAGGA